jgi:toxin ParE1/3/4
MRVRFTSRARNDLAEILEYLDRQNPGGARNVHRAIRRTIELIGQFPEAGRRTQVGETRVLPTGRYPFLIYWTINADEVWLVHIRHAARRPWRGE